jgi:uncharacterized protein (DUF1697 family)
MPTNAKMPELKRAFEEAGFTNVVTVLGSGNVVFDARTASVRTLEKKAREASGFDAFVRPIDELRKLLASDPYKGARLAANAKRIVTFVRHAPPADLDLPIERDGARILRFADGMVFSAYEPTPKGPVFMRIIGKAFGEEQTTRTWQTIEKVVSR